MLILADLRKELIFTEKDAMKHINALEKVNALLVTSEQLIRFSEYFSGGAIRYTEGTNLGFLEDILCYDNTKGSFMILTISQLATRKRKNENNTY